MKNNKSTTPKLALQGRIPNGPMKDIYEQAFVNQGTFSLARTWKNLYLEAGDQMDFWQDKVDAVFRWQWDNPGHPDYMAKVAEGQIARAQVEVWEAIGEGNVEDGFAVVEVGAQGNKSLMEYVYERLRERLAPVVEVA